MSTKKMMSLIASFATLACSFSAFAGTNYAYRCGSLVNTAGAPVAGSPIYNVEVENQNVILQTTTTAGIAHATYETLLTKTAEESPEISVYAAGNVQVVFSTMEMVMGYPHTAVSVNVMVGANQIDSASCQLIQN